MAYYCSKSKEEISEAEYNYSMKKYGVPLSRKEQKKFSASVDSKSDKKSNTKGFSLGYNVFRYGMENTVPGIMDLLKGVRSDVAYNIRRMPDFVVQKPKITWEIEKNLI